MYVRKSVLLFVALAGAAVTGWWLYLSDARSDAAISAPPAMAALDAQPVASAGFRTGHGIIIAQDGAIVFVGDHGILKANTGDVSASGTVAVDATDSTLSTGDSAGRAQSTLAVSHPRPTAYLGDSQGEVEDGPPGSESGSWSGSEPGSWSTPDLESTSHSPLGPNLGDRPVAISGLEDHSVNVKGDDQIVTYDDSNVFVRRDGKINANTGDTDSSGLNAVDVTGSTVRSGHSIEDSADDSDDGEEAEEPEEEDPGLTTGAAAATGDAQPSTGVTGNGRQGPDTASSVDPDAATTATGRNPLVIGGDGYDDLAIRTRGDRNVVSYDDSNVVIDGSGDVNAQIGDSDTSGAVVMGVHDSDVAAGTSQ